MNNYNKNDKMILVRIVKKQEYIINKQNSFELKDIFECGQCFRWNEQEDGSYTGIIKDGIINVKKENGVIIFTGMCNGKLKEIVEEYFDLNRDYEQIKKQLSNIDEYLKTSIEYGNGIRILNQDLWETIISFIISANNNIPRIKGIIERLSQKYGKEISWNGNKYYTFPTIDELSKASVKELRKLGLGFRDVRVFETTRIIANKIIDIEELEKIEDIETLRRQLLRLPGVGPKVADCIMLFSMKRFEVFPIDVWVKRVMKELYNEEIEKIEINNKKHFKYPKNSKENEKILEFANQKFGKIAGLAQQYLFYYRREH